MPIKIAMNGPIHRIPIFQQTSASKAMKFRCVDYGGQHVIWEAELEFTVSGLTSDMQGESGAAIDKLFLRQDVEYMSLHFDASGKLCEPTFHNAIDLFPLSGSGPWTFYDDQVQGKTRSLDCGPLGCTIMSFVNNGLTVVQIPSAPPIPADGKTVSVKISHKKPGDKKNPGEVSRGPDGSPQPPEKWDKDNPSSKSLGGDKFVIKYAYDALVSHCVGADGFPDPAQEGIPAIGRGTDSSGEGSGPVDLGGSKGPTTRGLFHYGPDDPEDGGKNPWGPIEPISMRLPADGSGGVEALAAFFASQASSKVRRSPIVRPWLTVGRPGRIMRVNYA